MRRGRTSAWLGILRALLPGSCILCGALEETRCLCRGCAVALPAIGRACRRCATPIAHVDDVCAACQAVPPPFVHAVSALLFAPPVTQLVHMAKFRGSLVAGRALGEALADHLEHAGQRQPDVLVPVPLHLARLRQRGYNQAHEVARPVARRLGVALRARAAARVVATLPQSSLDSRSARERNLRRAFAAEPAEVEGARVALVDDVLTSGATVRALTLALLAAGAREVQVWTAARAP